MTTDADRKMLAEPVLMWDFEFWKRQVEETPDIHGAVGRLNACGQLDHRHREQRLLYLMDLVGEERSFTQHTVSSRRREALATHAASILARLLDTEYRGDDIKYMPLSIIEKTLWLFRPLNLRTLERNDRFRGHDPEDNTSKILRRTRSHLCWKLWRGEMCVKTTLEHKIQALHIFYSIDRLFDFAPDARFTQHNWDDFEDVLPEIEKLAQMELELQPERYGLQSIEEAAYWTGSDACRLLLLLRPILIARTHWIDRKENYRGHRVNVRA